MRGMKAHDPRVGHHPFGLDKNSPFDACAGAPLGTIISLIVEPGAPTYPLLRRTGFPLAPLPSLIPIGTFASLSVDAG
jgi:hypothetical protein